MYKIEKLEADNGTTYRVVKIVASSDKKPELYFRIPVSGWSNNLISLLQEFTKDHASQHELMTKFFNKSDYLDFNLGKDF